MLDHITIAPAKREDMAEVARVFLASFSQALPHLPTLHTPQEDCHHFSNVVWNSNSVFIAQDPSAGIVGFIAFDEGFVNYLYLLPEAHRRGIGSRLLALAKENATTLRLWAFQRNPNALRFYEKHGFREIRRTNGSENEEKEPDVLLEWKREPWEPQP